MNAFKRNLILGYSFSLILVLASAIASFISINSLFKNNQKVDRTNLIISKLEHASSQLKDAETGQRGYLLTGEEIFLDPYKTSLPIIFQEIKDLRELVDANQLQQLTLIKFTEIVQSRMDLLALNISNRAKGLPINNDRLREGKMIMDHARELVAQMIDREKVELAKQTRTAEKFARSTPLLIIIASLLAIVITILSFLRINTEFTHRHALQLELEKKDKETTERIEIISEIAQKITQGNYTLKVDETAGGKLGILGGSLNQMSAALHESFTQITHNSWINSSLTNLTNNLLGEQTIATIAQGSLKAIAECTQSEIAAFYKYDDGHLEFVEGLAFSPAQGQQIIESGDGLAGRALSTKSVARIGKIQDADIYLNYTMGKLVPREIIATPFLFEGTVKAVMILGTMKGYEQNHIEYLESASRYVGILLNTAENRAHLRALLKQTQTQTEELTVQAEELTAQTEELSAQHSELEKANLELSIQSEKLKVSEEELRVQQEELMQSNTELEERTRLLEERNQMIAEQNRDIEMKADQLEQTSKYKSEFLANMSHELRTPLNSILLLSRLMADNLEKNLNAQQIEYANVIQGSGHSLLSLIDEILDLSKIESGKMELHYEIESLQEIVQNMHAIFDPVAAEKQIGFAITIADKTAAKIETDGPRLGQILKNLLSNAFKFTAIGSVKLEIAQTDQTVHFAVVDTGIGIAKDKQELVFEAFRQADGSTRRNYGGTGLGLSISRELAKLLGGELTLESEAGAGSTFKLSVPVFQAKNVPENIVHPQVIHETRNVPAARENRVPADIPVMTIKDDRNEIVPNDKVILIVEDDPVFAQALIQHTHRSGYKAIVSMRGDEALELANQFVPAGILLDIVLPVMNGWAVLDALKSAKRTRHIPVHVMSSSDAKDRSLSAGAVDFTNKPFGSEGMKEVFQKITQGLQQSAKKVLIVEENTMHAKALSYFLEANNLNAEITTNVAAAIQTLENTSIDCVILDMRSASENAYGILNDVRKTKGLENIAIIVFTGKNLSPAEEATIKKYADSIVIKTAHSYKRLLDEVSLFLHVMEINDRPKQLSQRNSALKDVLAHKKILVVDDDVRNIYSLTKVMEQYRMNVITAIDGRDAMRQLEEHQDIQLILMDMMMPEMDGYQTTRYIRNLPKYGKLPIIAVTAKAMTGDREKCIEAGASDYISKPVDTDQLVSLLRVWLYSQN